MGDQGGINFINNLILFSIEKSSEMTKKRKIGIFLVICYIFITYFTWIHEIRIFDFTYWYYGRYRMLRYTEIRDISTGEGLEEYALSTEWRFPYLYIYGITGYTKVTTIPFFNKIEKLPNMTVYTYNLKEPPHNPYQTTIPKLKESYGDRFILYDSFADFTESDQLIFEQLEDEGEQWLNYLKSERRKLFVKGLKNLR